jgi:hypothetical protein
LELGEPGFILVISNGAPLAGLLSQVPNADFLKGLVIDLLSVSSRLGLKDKQILCLQSLYNPNAYLYA